MQEETLCQIGYNMSQKAELKNHLRKNRREGDLRKLHNLKFLRDQLLSQRENTLCSLTFPKIPLVTFAHMRAKRRKRTEMRADGVALPTHLGEVIPAHLKVLSEDNESIVQHGCDVLVQDFFEFGSRGKQEMTRKKVCSNSYHHQKQPEIIYTVISLKIFMHART